MKHTSLKFSSVLTVLAIGTSAGLYLTAPAFQAAGSETKPQSRAASAPEWELKDADGKGVKLSDFKGKVVVLDFWATWCGPCRMEIPGFVELQKQYRDKGLVVIGVSLDEGG